MNTTEWLVVLAGIAAIAWVNWYFLLAERSGITRGAQRSGEEEKQ